MNEVWLPFRLVNQPDVEGPRGPISHPNRKPQGQAVRIFFGLYVPILGIISDSKFCKEAEFCGSSLIVPKDIGRVSWGTIEELFLPPDISFVCDMTGPFPALLISYLRLTLD